MSVGQKEKALKTAEGIKRQLIKAMALEDIQNKAKAPEDIDNFSEPQGNTDPYFSELDIYENRYKQK